MGAYAARKAIDAVENFYRILGYEAATASQALSFTPEKAAPRVVAFIEETVRRFIQPITEDTYIAPQLEALVEHLHHCHTPT
jgi:histidine ammonia-lyase